MLEGDPLPPSKHAREHQNDEDPSALLRQAVRSDSLIQQKEKTIRSFLGCKYYINSNNKLNTFFQDAI